MECNTIISRTSQTYVESIKSQSIIDQNGAKVKLVLEVRKIEDDCMTIILSSDDEEDCNSDGNETITISDSEETSETKYSKNAGDLLEAVKNTSTPKNDSKDLKVEYERTPEEKRSKEQSEESKDFVESSTRTPGSDLTLSGISGSQLLHSSPFFTNDSRFMVFLNEILNDVSILSNQHSDAGKGESFKEDVKETRVDLSRDEGIAENSRKSFRGGAEDDEERVLKVSRGDSLVFSDNARFVRDLGDESGALDKEEPEGNSGTVECTFENGGEDKAGSSGKLYKYSANLEHDEGKKNDEEPAELCDSSTARNVGVGQHGITTGSGSTNSVVGKIREDVGEMETDNGPREANKTGASNKINNGETGNDGRKAGIDLWTMGTTDAGDCSLEQEGNANEIEENGGNEGTGGLISFGEGESSTTCGNGNEEGRKGTAERKLPQVVKNVKVSCGYRVVRLPYFQRDKSTFSTEDLTGNVLQERQQNVSRCKYTECEKEKLEESELTCSTKDNDDLPRNLGTEKVNVDENDNYVEQSPVCFKQLNEEEQCTVLPCSHVERTISNKLSEELDRSKHYTGESDRDENCDVRNSFPFSEKSAFTIVSSRNRIEKRHSKSVSESGEARRYPLNVNSARASCENMLCGNGKQDLSSEYSGFEEYEEGKSTANKFSEENSESSGKMNGQFDSWHYRVSRTDDDEMDDLFLGFTACSPEIMYHGIYNRNIMKTPVLNFSGKSLSGYIAIDDIFRELKLNGDECDRNESEVKGRDVNVDAFKLNEWQSAVNMTELKTWQDAQVDTSDLKTCQDAQIDTSDLEEYFVNDKKSSGSSQSKIHSRKRVVRNLTTDNKFCKKVKYCAESAVSKETVKSEENAGSNNILTINDIYNLLPNTFAFMCVGHKSFGEKTSYKTKTLISEARNFVNDNSYFTGRYMFHGTVTRATAHRIISEINQMICDKQKMRETRQTYKKRPKFDHRGSSNFGNCSNNVE